MNWSLLLADARGIALTTNRPRPGDWQFGWDRVGMIAGVAAAIILATWLLMRLIRARAARNNDSPWRLFSELCAAHNLSRRERHLITRLAQQRKIEQPATVFVDASWWNAESLGTAWTPSMPELERLRRRLFAPR